MKTPKTLKQPIKQTVYSYGSGQVLSWGTPIARLLRGKLSKQEMDANGIMIAKALNALEGLTPPDAGGTKEGRA